MSTKGLISEALLAGKIVKHVPYVSRDKELRTLYLHSQGMQEVVDLEHSDDKWVQRLWELRFHLDHFVTGTLIDPNYLKPLQPPSKGVYEIRNRRPKPSIRAFGMFLQKDCLFLSHFCERAPLKGGGKNYQFHQEITKSRQFFRQVFPNLGVKTGSITELVTGGQDEKILK